MLDVRVVTQALYRKFYKRMCAQVQRVNEELGILSPTLLPKHVSHARCQSVVRNRQGPSGQAITMLYGMLYLFDTHSSFWIFRCVSRSFKHRSQRLLSLSRSRRSRGLRKHSSHTDAYCFPYFDGFTADSFVHYDFTTFYK